MNIREYRKKKGLTMKQLGEAIGVSESSISLYETGKRTPDIDLLMSMADVLGVSVTDLLGIETPKVEYDPTLPWDEPGFQHGTPQDTPKTPQARILAAGIDRMPERDREKALNLVMMMFEQYADFFERSDDDDS